MMCQFLLSIHSPPCHCLLIWDTQEFHRGVERTCEPCIKLGLGSIALDGRGNGMDERMHRLLWSHPVEIPEVGSAVKVRGWRASVQRCVRGVHWSTQHGNGATSKDGVAVLIRL